MPWKGLWLGGSDNKKANAELGGSSRHADQGPRQYSVEAIPSRHSENPPRHRGTNGIDHHKHDDAANPDHSNHPTPSQNTKRNRFSVMRFRHASDPQLSVTYQNAEPPPVPSLPPPPTIITTSPTVNLADRSTPKDRVKTPQSNQPSQANPPPNNSRDTQPQNADRISHEGAPNAAVTTSPTAPSTVKSSHISFEEPGRLSTTSAHSTGTRLHHSDWPGSGLFPGRPSDSSRSDASSGDNQPKKEPTPTSSIFRFPKLKKSRGNLFPVPIKITPSEQPRSLPPSTTGDGSPDRHSEQTSSPLHSPSRSSIERPSSTAGSPATQLFRRDSLRSLRSRPSLSRGSSVAKRRARSSTVGSLPNIQDDPVETPPDQGPSRSSTYGATRKSFSDLFHLNRFKQHELVGSPGGSPSVGGPVTPASTKPNSFSMIRDLSSHPVREEDDTPGAYLTRLGDAVPRKIIATILSQSPDEFYSVALRKYMRGFSFFGDPLDMAIRKLLMEVELPRETQQIDRVLQAFANRYHECNPGIFSSTDQAYFIAFSILILHTDVFNKNNKRKMQKHDYVKNTQGEGISEEILECFYDNVCYTPFIHVEDEINLSGKLSAPKSRNPLAKVTTSTDHLLRSSRDPIDPYTLVLEGKLDALRPNLKHVMELEDWYGTGTAPDINKLHHVFYKPCILQIVSARSRPDAFLTHFSLTGPGEPQPGLVDIRVAKVGLLWRKDPKKKKARSPWQEWGAVLTGSQLYLFRNYHWVKTLVSQYESRQKHGRHQPVTFKPPVADFKPDAIMSTVDAVALLDSSYKRHKNALVLIRHGGLEEVFLANSEADRRDWTATINYAAAYRTTGVRMRGMIGANYEGPPLPRTTRADSTASEVSDISSPDVVSARKVDPHLAEEVSTARRALMVQRIGEANEKLLVSQKKVDELLQNARHLQHLTPIHPRARDQTIIAAGRMSAKIKWARLELWRTKCYLEILTLDLSDEEQGLAGSAAVDNIAVNVPLPVTPNGQGHSNDLTASPGLLPSSMGEQTFDNLQLGTSIASANPDLLPSASQSRRASLQRSIKSSSRKGSTAGSKDGSSLSPDAPIGDQLLRQVSVTSTRPGTTHAVDTSDHATPTPSIMDDEEQRFLIESGFLAFNTSPTRPKTPEASVAPEDDAKEEQSGRQSSENRSKIRRSLQRTLRESNHLPHPHRSKKGKDAAASPSADGKESQDETAGLKRTTGSFTVHGKKASVITFGSEWQNMTTEQRLKQRKLQSEDSRASDLSRTEDGTDSAVSGSVKGLRSFSAASISTTGGRSFRVQDGPHSPLEIPSVAEAPDESQPGAGEHIEPRPAGSEANDETADERPQNEDAKADSIVQTPSHTESNHISISSANKENSPELSRSRERLDRIPSEQAVEA